MIWAFEDRNSPILGLTYCAMRCSRCGPGIRVGFRELGSRRWVVEQLWGSDLVSCADTVLHLGLQNPGHRTWCAAATRGSRLGSGFILLDSLSFLGSMQWIIKQLWDKGLVYQVTGCSTQGAGTVVQGSRSIADKAGDTPGPACCSYKGAFTLGLGNRVQGQNESMSWAVKLLYGSGPKYHKVLRFGPAASCALLRL